jgi:5-methylcytosine-specific restriction endonuclease McrA
MRVSLRPSLGEKNEIRSLYTHKLSANNQAEQTAFASLRHVLIGQVENGQLVDNWKKMNPQPSVGIPVSQKTFMLNQHPSTLWYEHLRRLMDQTGANSRQLVNELFKCQRELEDTQSFKQLIAELESEPITFMGRGPRNYVLYRRTVWSSVKHHSDEEWKLLVHRQLKCEGKELDRLSNAPTNEQSAPRREAIPEEVRIAVWRRDGGQCARCASRENLEYDHIIPVSKGGSNTARNIELLCQSCNRSKKDSIM